MSVPQVVVKWDVLSKRVTADVDEIEVSNDEFSNFEWIKYSQYLTISKTDKNKSPVLYLIFSSQFHNVTIG